MLSGTDQHKARSTAADRGATSDRERHKNDESTETDERIHQYHEHVGELLATRQYLYQPLLVKERPQTDGKDARSRQLHNDHYMLPSGGLV